MNGEYNQAFWGQIEEEIGGKIPEMVKSVLSKSGYEIRFCLENLTATDIEDIEKYAKNNLKDKLKRWIESDGEYEHLNPSEFAFLPGHRKMISLIPKKLFALKEAELALKSTADDISASIPSNNRSSISIAQEAKLEAELCGSIRNWMVGKKFHESVS